MNVAVLDKASAEKAAGARTGIIDCDIHPSMKTGKDLHPFLSQRWQHHFETYGAHVRQAYSGSQAYPRMSPGTARGDSWPPGGGPPASDLPFMRAQHLDAHNIETGILHPLRIGGYNERNPDFAVALCSAINDWQIAAWIDPEPRLRGSIYVGQDYPEAAVAEIERRAADPRLVQVSFAPHAQEPLGRRRYWPIFAAAVAAKRPIGLHIGGISGFAPSPGGWFSYYFEHHFSTVPAMQSLVTSLVLEGVFEQFPSLKFILVETGFAWVPALGWRLDQHWARMRDEVPHVKRPPSEYIRDHFYFTTQPIEEPDPSRHLREVIDWIGWDKILFSTDYPHWDFDDPGFAIKLPLSPSEKEGLFRGNAKAVYGLS